MSAQLDQLSSGIIKPSTEAKPKGSRSSIDDIKDVAKANKPSLINLINSFEAEDAYEGDRRIGIPEIWEKMKALPWARHSIKPMKAVLAARKKAMPRLPDEGENDYICRLVERIGKESSEALSPLPKGKVIVYDLKAYSKYINHVDPIRRRKIQDEAFPAFGQKLCQDHGISMLQPIAGDKLMFFFEDSGDDKKDKLRMKKLFRSMLTEHVNTGMTPEEIEKLGLDPSMYPNGCFMASIGVAQVAENELYLGNVVGPGNHDQGVSAVLGAAYVRALQLQANSGGNQINCDEKFRDWLGSDGLNFEKSKKNPDHQVVCAVAPVKDVEPLNLDDKDLDLPEDKILQRALMLVLGYTLHQRGSFSEFSASVREQVAKQVEALGVANNLGPTTLFLVYGEEEDMGTRPEAFIRALNVSLEILAQEKYKGFYVAKMDEHFLVLQTRAHPEETKDLLPSLFSELDTALNAEDVKLPLTAGGVSRDKMMTSTTYRIYGGFARDGAGPGYVESARLAKADDENLPRIRVAFSYTQAGGVPGEHMSLSTKGGDILMLGLEPHETSWQVRELIESERPALDLRAKLLELKNGRNIIRIAPLVNREGSNGEALPELENTVLAMGGFGTSAILRQLEDEYPGRCLRLEAMGNGSMPMTRALLCQLAKMRALTEARPGQLFDLSKIEASYLGRGEAELEAEMEKIMTSEMEWLEEPLWFLLDQNFLSETDKMFIQRFFDALRGRDVGLVHTGNFSFEDEQIPVLVPEKTVEGMCKIIFQQRPDYNESLKSTVREPLRAVLESYLVAYPELPRGPRLAFRLAERMKWTGSKIELPTPDQFTIGQREAGVRIEKQLHSPSARTLLSLLSVLGTYISEEQLSILAHKFAYLPPSVTETSLQTLFEYGFVRRDDLGRVKVISTDVQVAAEMMHDAFTEKMVRSQISKSLLDDGPLDAFGRSYEGVQVTSDNLYELKIHWEHEMRCEELYSGAIELTHALGMYFYQRGDLNSAFDVFDRFYQSEEMRHVEHVQFYLDMARVFLETGNKTARNEARNIYNYFFTQKVDQIPLEVRLESIWYRDYRLPTIDSHYLEEKVDESDSRLDRMNSKNREEAKRLLGLVDLLSPFIDMSLKDEDPVSLRAVHLAWRVEHLFRRLLLELRHVDPDNREGMCEMVKESDELVKELSSINLDGDDSFMTEVKNTTLRYMGGVLKLVAEAHKDHKQKLAYLKDSAEMVRETLESFRAQSRPDYEQAREANFGYFITETTRYYMLISAAQVNDLIPRVAEIRKDLRRIQSELVLALDQCFCDGAPLKQRDGILQCMENAFYLEAQLEAKCQLIDSDRDRIRTAASHYLWTNNERRKISPSLGLDMTKRTKHLDHLCSMMKSQYDTYLGAMGDVSDFEVIKKSRPTEE